MTTTEIIQRVKLDLDDAGITWTDQDIYDSLQDGYDEIAFYTECIEKMVQVAFPAGKTYWNIRTDVPDYFRVFGIYDPNTRDWLTPVGLKTVRSMCIKWETVLGIPRYFIPFGFDTVAFYPHYETAPTESMQLYYIAQAPDFTSSANLIIPSNCRRVAVDYVNGDLLAQTDELTKSMMYNERYMQGLERVTTELTNRTKADRFMGFIERYAHI